MNEQERIQQALSLSLTAGYHLDEEAYELLTTISKREDPAKLIELTLKKMEANTQKPLFISKRLLEEMATEVFGITRDLRQPDIPTFSPPQKLGKYSIPSQRISRKTLLCWMIQLERFVPLAQLMNM